MRQKLLGVYKDKNFFTKGEKSNIYFLSVQSIDKYILYWYLKNPYYILRKYSIKLLYNQKIERILLSISQ